MKKICLYFVFISSLIYSQEMKKLDIKDYVVKASFLENKFDKKYLLIGDFLPVAEDSDIKLAKVFTETGWGYIDEKGNEIVKPVYHKLPYFRYGLIRAERKVPSPKDDEEADSYSVLINYRGEIITNEETDIPYHMEDEIFYQKDFFIISRNDLYGTMNNNGNIIVPFKYQEIEYNKEYFFAYQKSTEGNYHRVVDIYSKSGKLLKSLLNYGIREDGEQLITHNGKGLLFLDSSTFQPIDTRIFSSINKVVRSEKVKLVVTFPNEKEDLFPEFYPALYLDKDLHIISPDFPGVYIYEDRFLVQPLPVSETPEKAEKFAIIDFNNNKIAEYNAKDFRLYQYYASGRLNDPKFLESQRSFWSRLQADTDGKSERMDHWDHERNIQQKNRFSKFYETDGAGKRISVGYIDSDTGEVIIKRNLKDKADTHKIKSQNLLYVTYVEDEIPTIDLYDDKGKILKTFPGLYINEVSKHFLTVVKDTCSIENKTVSRKNILNLKTLGFVFKEDMNDFDDCYYDENKDYLIFTDQHSQSSIIDKNYNSVIELRSYSRTPTSMPINYPEKDLVFLKKAPGSIEILDTKTFKPIFEAEFKNGILKNFGDRDPKGNLYLFWYQTGYYSKGFYFINEEKNVMDRYGNIVPKPEGFDIYQK